MYPILFFLPYKGKGSTSLLSLTFNKINTECFVCNKQTKITTTRIRNARRNVNKITYTIFSHLHQEQDKPSTIEETEKYWYRNNKIHRSRKDTQGNIYPAVIEKAGVSFYKNNYFRISKDNDGYYNPSGSYMGSTHWSHEHRTIIEESYVHQELDPEDYRLSIPTVYLTEESRKQIINIIIDNYFKFIVQK